MIDPVMFWLNRVWKYDWFGAGALIDPDKEPLLIQIEAMINSDQESWLIRSGVLKGLKPLLIRIEAVIDSEQESWLIEIKVLIDPEKDSWLIRIEVIIDSE